MIAVIAVLLVVMFLVYFATLKLTAPITEVAEIAKKLGNGDFSFVMPDTDVTIVVKTRQAFEWSIRSFKSKFGDFLKTWTITGSISGEHKDEATFKVAKGESLEISFTAKDEERLFRLSIESGGEDRIV